MTQTARPIAGLVVPLLSPLTEQETIDVAALERHVEYVLASPCDGLFILGSNGEGAMLTARARREMAKETIRIAAGRVPVIAGVLEVSTSRVLEGVADLAGLGLGGYVATSPLYFDGFSEDDLYRHFSAIAGAADAPLLLYNIPQYTSARLSESLVRRCATIPNIVGLKDSSGNWADFQGLVLDRPTPDFVVLQGYQPASAVSLFIGADGLIPGLSNLEPALIAALYEHASNGRWPEALQLQARVDHLLRIRGRALIHANKIIANGKGLMESFVTSPLPHLNETEASSLLLSFDEAREVIE